MRTDRQTRSRRTGPAAAAVCAALALLVLAVCVASGATAAIDRAALAAIASWRRPAGELVFGALTRLGSFYVVAPLAAAVMWRLARTGQAAAAMATGFTVFGAALATLALKALIERARPAAGMEAVTPVLADAAFPSGHTTHAWALALGLYWVARRWRPHWRGPVLWLWPLALLVALSRLYLLVHWPSDVLGGLLVALAWTSLAAALWSRAPS